jgi:hypothetical protein
MSHLALSNEIVHNVCTDAFVKLLNPCPDCAPEQICCIVIFGQQRQNTRSAGNMDRA